jgi:hypothetical protein
MKKFFFFVLSLITIILIVSCSNKCPSCPSCPPGYMSATFSYLSSPSLDYHGVYDTFIMSSNPYFNNGGSCGTFLEAGLDAGSINRTLIKFDVSTLPANASVKEAHLIFYASLTQNAAPVTFAAYAMAERWFEGSECMATAVGNDAAWNSFTPAGEYSASLAAVSQDLVISDPREDHYDLMLNTSLVKSWITSESTNYGILLKSKDESASGYISIINHDNTIYTTSYYHPQLTIYYTLN